MVGWSRRSRESSERRERWWNSLTEEQKQQWLADKPKRDKQELKLILLLLAAFCLWMGFLSFLAKDKEDYAKEHGPCLEWSQHMVGPIIGSRCDKWSKP